MNIWIVFQHNKTCKASSTLHITLTWMITDYIQKDISSIFESTSLMSFHWFFLVVNKWYMCTTMKHKSLDRKNNIEIVMFFKICVISFFFFCLVRLIHIVLIWLKTFLLRCIGVLLLCLWSLVPNISGFPQVDSWNPKL